MYMNYAKCMTGVFQQEKAVNDGLYFLITLVPY